MKHILITVTVIAVLLGVGGLWLYAGPQAAPQAQSLPPAPSISPVAVASPLATTHTVGTATTTTLLITVGTSTPVTVSIQISDPALITNSVNLLRLGATGTQPTILGVMQSSGNGIYTLQHVFNEPAAGQIQLQVSAAFKGALQRALSNVVVVSAGNTFTDTTSKVSFTLPQFSVPTQATSTVPTTGLSHIDIQAFNQAAQIFLPVIGMVVYSNPTRLSLSLWFSDNVDVNNILVNAGVFQPEVINGSDVLLLVGSVPSQYPDGPVDIAYMMSPTGDRVVGITQGQEAQTSDYGYDATNLVTALLNTFRFN
jgi:hypothetical protein